MYNVYLEFILSTYILNLVHLLRYIFAEFFICDNVKLSGIHPTTISESFQKAVDKGVEVLTSMSRPVELSDRETLLNSATTSLCSKVVSQYSSLLAPMSVDAVMRVIDPATATGVDLQDIKIIKKLG